MAESAQPDLSAAMSPTGDIKQEPNILDGLDLDAVLQAATKRPFEDTNGDDPSKRVKAETETTTNHNTTFDSQDGAEESLEDGLALLVQNALSNVGDLVSQFTQNSDMNHTTDDPMDVDTAPPPEVDLPPVHVPIPVSFFSDPQKHLRKLSRHALGNLAISILLIFSQPFDESIKPILESTSQHYQSFRLLKSSFEQTRQIYSTSPILSPEELDMHDDESRTILDLSNLAQFGVWLLSGDLLSYSEAHHYFHSVFRGQISDLGSDVTELLLAFKTQMAVEALASRSPEGQVDQLLNEALTDGIEDKLRGLHGCAELTPSDLEFISSLRSRREMLQGEAQLDTAALREKHPVDTLLRYFGTHAKNRLPSVTDLGSRLGLEMPIIEPSPMDFLGDGTGDTDLDLDDLSSFFEKTTSGLVQNALAGLTDENPEPVPAVETTELPVEPPPSPPKEEPPAQQTPSSKVDLLTDYKELEALVAESTSNYVKTTLHGLSPVPYQPTVPTSTAQSYLSQLQQSQAHPFYSYTQSIPEPQPPQPPPGENLPPHQTFPSAVLYDKARQAALSKSSAHTRREGLHSTRRPWTQEEEKALMAGLDMVKGPHWSQILTLFGQNGTISDILKDRTQVQLKDKARNLKLFFLKTNSEMPYYLQAVTGELKTRAPTQAARKEAEERARMNSEEDQARIQGIMTLAGGLQNPPQGRTAGSPATAVGSGVMTPAQAAQVASSQHNSMAHHHQAQSHALSAAATSGYPASSLPQARPSMPTQTTQSLHSVSQPPPRPQSQLPQTPRPHSQHSHHQTQNAMHSPAQAQAMAQSRSQTSTPVGQMHHSPSVQHVQTPQSTHHMSAQPTQPQHPQYSPHHHQHQQQQSFPSPPSQAQHMQSHTPTPMSHHDMNDNAAEAALLQGLQAAVAESS